MDRSILVVFMKTILTISCMSTYPLHACQWLSKVSTPVSCNVYWLQSRVCTPGVGLLMMMIWLELCTSCSCSCQHHLSHSNKMQNGGILVPADPGLPGKMSVEMGRESIWLCGLPWVWVIIHCMWWLITCEIWFCQDSHENGWLIRALVTSRLKHNNSESDGEVLVI